MSVQRVLTNLADRIRFYTKKEDALRLEQMPEEIDLVYEEGVEWAVREVNDSLGWQQLPLVDSSAIRDGMDDALETQFMNGMQKGAEEAINKLPKAEITAF